MYSTKYEDFLLLHSLAARYMNDECNLIIHYMRASDMFHTLALQASMLRKYSMGESPPRYEKYSFHVAKFDFLHAIALKMKVLLDKSKIRF